MYTPVHYKVHESPNCFQFYEAIQSHFRDRLKLRSVDYVGLNSAKLDMQQSIDIDHVGKMRGEGHLLKAVVPKTRNEVGPTATERRQVSAAPTVDSPSPAPARPDPTRPGPGRIGSVQIFPPRPMRRTFPAMKERDGRFDLGPSDEAMADVGRVCSQSRSAARKTEDGGGPPFATPEGARRSHHVPTQGLGRRPRPSARGSAPC